MPKVSDSGSRASAGVAKKKKASKLPFSGAPFGGMLPAGSAIPAQPASKPRQPSADTKINKQPKLDSKKGTKTDEERGVPSKKRAKGDIDSAEPAVADHADKSTKGSVPRASKKGKAVDADDNSPEDAALRGEVESFLKAFNYNTDSDISEPEGLDEVEDDE